MRTILILFLLVFSWGTSKGAEIADKQKLSLRKSVASEQFLDVGNARCLEALDRCQERIVKASKSATCMPSSEREAELEKENALLKLQNDQYFKAIQCYRTGNIECLKQILPKSE